MRLYSIPIIKLSYAPFLAVDDLDHPVLIIQLHYLPEYATLNKIDIKKKLF